MTIQDFIRIIRREDRVIAPGGESGLWGDFVTSMMSLDEQSRQETTTADRRSSSGGDHGVWESQTHVDDLTRHYWLTVYELYTADQEQPVEDQAEDLRDITDAAFWEVCENGTVGDAGSRFH